ncbi:hypothetical protein V2K65_25940 [Pseudomonas alliivorans]|nr:hypothetical protein [Pseudomonas alliivorans]
MSSTQTNFVRHPSKNGRDAHNLSSLMERLTTLISRDLARMDNDADIQSLASLTDDQLLLEVISKSATLRSAMDERQLKKELRRAKAKQEFYEDLKEFGGTVKAKDAAVLLNATRQTVNNHIKNGKLIGIKDGTDYLIPAFQFLETGKVNHLEEILGLMSKCAPITQCSFFMASMVDEGKPYEARISVLRRGPTQQELDYIKRDAKLLLSHTAS